MKCCLLIIILFFATNLIKNANSVDEGRKESKLYKSFDEIFGKGWDDESNDSKELNCRHVKEEVQDGQAPITSDQKNIEDKILKQKFDEIYDENWSEDENSSAPSVDNLDQENSKKHLSDQNNSTDQDESVDQQPNKSNECEKIESDQQKREIIQKFREMKDNYKKDRTYSRKEWAQIDKKMTNDLGISRTTIYRWSKELGLSRETMVKSKFSELEKRNILKQFDKCKKANLKNISMNELDEKIAKKFGVCARTIREWKREFGLSFRKFSEFEKREILKQFDEIKSKCQKAKLKNSSMHELDKKIAEKLGVGARTISEWKRKFGLSASYKISDATKIGILKKYAKIKRKNPKMTDAVIAKMLKISTGSLSNWKNQFQDEINRLLIIRTL